LAAIYLKRGLDLALAQQVAKQLMACDALGYHARDESEISKSFEARPIQAAPASAASFSVGAAMPILVAVSVPPSGFVAVVCVTTLGVLALLGGLAAQVGGVPVAKGSGRVTLWGALVMAVTAGARTLFGRAV